MSAYLQLEQQLHAFERRVREVSDPTPARGYTVRQMLILKVLYENDGQRASDLAKAVNLPATSFTPILDSLELHSLITRIPHPTDRRAVNIVLTRPAKDKAFNMAIINTLDIVEKEFKGVLK